jgi:hypothetical protein
MSIELPSVGQHFRCKANRTAIEPQDCDWPVCGCDPYADKVLMALEESGALVDRAAHDRRVTELLEANTREVDLAREMVATFMLERSIATGHGDTLGALLGELGGYIERIEKLIYVPGVWKCPKCQCSLVSTFLDAGSGRAAANKEPQRCPNDCGPMWRVTERDAGNRLIDDMESEVERRREAEARLAWRSRDEVPETDELILGYSPVCGGDEDEGGPADHYGVTTGRWLRQGGWEDCTLWLPIIEPVDRQGGSPR